MAIELIKMVRAAEDANGGPTEADVHPDEVVNYSLAGFVVAQAANPEKPSKPLGAAELIEKIKAAATAAEVEEMLGKDTRATVVAAAEARKNELQQPQE